jgi:threonine/homoserine/homoserine lactone efflux protein
MQPVELTFGRAFKVWWSYAWRAFVLGIPVAVVMMIVWFVLLMPYFPHPGQRPDPALMQAAMGRFSVLWFVFMFLYIVIQVLAMRWMLKTKWSDFRLLPTNDGLQESTPAMWKP